MSEVQLHNLTQCTLAELIRAGEAYLSGYQLVYGHGTDNAFDEAAWLALEACGISPAEPLESYDIPVLSEQLLCAKEWFIKRAVDKVPVAYLTGRAWFAGLEFLVDDRALIPRSPIAELIHNGFEPWMSRAPKAALDMCCGGGCIAIALANRFSGCAVDAVDLSQNALDLAVLNVNKHELQNQVTLYQSDLLSRLPQRQYDLIVSNPPYVDAEDMGNLATEFGHEPQMGLAAGSDGLDIVARLLRDAKQYLKPDGILIIEVGNSMEAVDRRFTKLDLTWLEFEYGGEGVFLISARAL